VSKSKLAIILTAIVALTIVIVVGFVFPGVAPVPVARIIPRLALLAETANTPTPTRVPATVVPVATVQSSLAMASGQHVAVSCPSNLTLAQGDLACLVGQASPTSVPATGTPVVVPTDTAIPSGTPISTVTAIASSATPTATQTPISSGSPTLTPTSIAVTGPTWYVSRGGANADGRSWAGAWSDFSNINWPLIRPGDTILVDGGAVSMTYTTTLGVGASGTASSPITIRLAPDAGRNGQAIIFGGRSTPLPYCEQPVATYSKTPGTRLHGIDFGSTSYVVIDGTKWSGIVVKGHDDFGIQFSGTHNTLKYLLVTDNGQQNPYPSAPATQTGWRTDQPGIHPNGSDLLIDHLNIDSNGQDSVQSGSAVNNLTIRYSWLHNSRSHPVYGPAVSFGYCMHQDGTQLYGNYTSTGLLFDHDIFGPGFLQGTLLGQSGSSTRNVNNVTFTNDLFTGTYNQGIGGYAGIQNNNWLISNVTIYMPRSPNWKTSNPGGTVGDGYNQSIKMDQSSTGLRVSNTVIYDGNIVIPPGTFSNNCQFNLISGTIGGTVANPQFASPPPATVPDATGGLNSVTPSHPTLAELEAADYTITGGACLGKGSSVTSVAQLLAQ